MKRIYLYQILILAVLALSSCQDEFLEEEVYSSLSVENAFDNPEDAILAVNGIYGGFQSEVYYGRNILHMADLAGGTGRGYYNNQYDRFVYDDNETFVREFWIQGYQLNLRANIVIENVPKGDIEESLKSRYLGEAKFLRALNYFNLVRLYGNIPLVLTVPENPKDPESLLVGQSSHDEVYQSIISDLKYAREALPASYEEGYGRATWGAATALLAKVYLTYAGLHADPKSGSLLEGDPVYYDSAALMAGEVIESGLYALENDFRTIFDNTTESTNSEAIFSIQYLEGTGGFEGLGGEGTTYPTQHAPKGSGILSNEYKTYGTSIEFYNSFDSDDERVPYTFLTSYENRDGVVISFPELPLDLPHVNKYLFETAVEGPNPQFSNINDGDYGDDFIVIRYADVLLMMAEALNEIDPASAQALDYLNDVRERAGLNDVGAIDQQDLRDKIFVERRKELCFEGHAWFDLIRTGRFLDFIKSSDSRGAALVSERNRLYPIPLSVLNANTKLGQNFGY